MLTRGVSPPSAGPQRAGFRRVLIRAGRGETDRVLTTFGWVLFAVGSILFLGQLLRPIDPQDEGQFLTYPWLIALGRVPYRDIWMSYPPATYLLLVPFAKLGLWLVIPERALGLGARILYILLVNRLLTGSWRRWSWTVGPAALALVFLGSDVKAYPWLVALPLFVFGLASIARSPSNAALAFFAAGTFRFEFALAGAVALGMMCLLHLRQWWAAVRFLRSTAATCVLTVAFYGCVALLTGGAAWHDIFTDQVTTVQSGRYLSLFPLPFGPLGVPVLFALLVVPLVCVLLGFVGRRRDIVATNVAVLCLLPHFFQRVDASHLFSTAALVVPWGMLCLTRILQDPASEGRGTRGFDWVPSVASGALMWLSVTVSAWSYLIMLAYGVFLSPISPAAPLPPTQFSRLLVHGERLGIASDLQEARDDRRVVSYLREHAQASDGVLILPSSLSSSYTRTDLYYVLGIRPVGRYLEVQPNVVTRNSAQRSIVKALHDCRWVVLLQGGRWYGPSDPSRPYYLGLYIRAHYRRVLDTPTFSVLKDSR